MSDSIGKLRQLHQQHDELIVQLRNERQALGLDPTQIPPALGERAARFTGELRDLGASLYATTDRSAALALMAYWINALYRAGWYQERRLDPPAPELPEFAPEAQPPLRDEDYPWVSAQGHGVTPESRVLWARMSAQAVTVLASRRLLGITGAAGSGRSHLIDHGIRPALREKAGGAGVIEHILNPGEAILDGAAQPAGAALEDRRFLTALLPIARAAAGGGALNEAALERDPAVLARLLDATGKRHLVIVHEFHRLFTLACDPFELEPSGPQRAFISALCAIACSAGGHQVIVDVQTDFLGRLRKFEDFRALIDRPDAESAQDGWLVVAFEAGEIRKFITEPAGRIGLHFEAGLVDRLVFEHQAEPAAITLLLFTLRRLWRDMLLYHCDPGERRNMITWMSYRRVGSGRLVFEIAADEATKAVLDRETSAEEKEQALDAIRIMFLELVRILPGSSFWLPKVPRAAIESALESDGHPASRIARIFDEFSRVGLLVGQSAPTAGEPVLRIFHDAVVSRWTRLVQWVEAKRADRRTYWLFRADARDWNRLREPSPAVTNAGWWARTKDRILRLHSRQSRLWRGSKLREATAFPDLTELNPYETDFLRVSRRMWVLSLAVLTAGIAAIPVAIIILFMLREAQQRSLNMALFMDRGLNLVAEGDPGSASLWLAEARQLDYDTSWKRFISFRSPVSEEVHKLSIGMAFRRMPDLQALATVADGLISTDLSPSGSYALLGCRKKGDTPGRAILWTLGGQPGVKTELMPRLEGREGDFSIERVAFAKWADDAAPRTREDTLMAVGGSVGDGARGVVFVWDVAKPGEPMRFDFGDGVRDLAFFPGRKDEPCRLAVAFGDPSKEPARGGVRVIEIAPSRGLPTVADLPVTGPATRLVVSGNGRLAVAIAEPQTKTSRVHVFTNEKEDGDLWKSEVIDKVPLPVTDLALAKDGCTLAIATANSDSSTGSVLLFKKKISGTEWVAAIADAPLQLGSGIQRVEFSPDGHSLLGGAANGVIGIWTVEPNGKAVLLRKLTEGGWTYSTAWSPDGRWIATGNRDRHARLWDASSGRLVLPPLYQGGTVSNVRFTLDGLHLLTNTVYAARLWGTAPSEDSLQSVQAVERRGSHALLSEDGQRVAVASVLSGQARDGIRETDLALWQLNPEKSPAGDGRLRRLPTLDPIAAGPDAGTLAARTEAQRQVPAESLLPMGRLRRLPKLDTVASSPDGRTLAALTEPQKQIRRLLVWNTTGKQPIEAEVNVGADFLGFIPGSPPRLLVAGALTSPQRLLSAVAQISPEWLQCAGAAAAIERALADGKSIAGLIQLFDILPGGLQPGRQMPLEFRVKSCAATKDGRLLAIGGDSGESPRGGFIGVLDVGKAAQADGRPVHTGTAAAAPISPHLEAVTSLAFSPQGDWLISGSIDDHVKLFTVAATSVTPQGGAGNPPASQWIGITPAGGPKPTKHTADVTSVGFSRDGRLAATTGRDSMAILWEVTGEGLKQSASLDHRGVARHAFSADDRWLATGGDEGARLWSLKTDGRLRQGELVATLPHRFPVVGIAFTASGSAPGLLCTLAHEKPSSDPTSPRAVEAHRWSLASRAENPAEIQNQASLLAGRRLDMERLRVVDLGGEDLEKLWAASHHKLDPPPIDRTAHLSRAAAAAAAGDWNAASMHLRELPELSGPATAGGSEEVLRFAVEIFTANHQPEDVFNTIEKLEPETIADSETSLDLMEKRGEACIQVARAAGTGPIALWLERAEKDFRALAEKQPAEAAWRTRRAEICVLRGKLPEAIALLEESKRLASLPTAPDARFVMRFTAASQDQRIAAIHLLLATDAQRDRDEAEASRQREQWEQLVRKAIEKHTSSKAFEKGRAAWPAVLGESQDQQVIRQALAFSEEAHRDQPDSYGRLNTYATALLRAGQFDAALSRLKTSIDLYERERDPLDRGKPGRPVDWVVHALILQGRSAQEKDVSKREGLLAEARNLIEAAEKSLLEETPQSRITWRATWNKIDLQVLLAEAKRKLNRK